jgi:RimJ/RimL family protein N-acetyltransferase
MKIILETPRLLLREMTLDDLDFVAAMLAHPEVMRFYPQLYSRQEAEGWVRRSLARYAKDGVALWLVAAKESGEPVGQVGLIMQLIEGVWEPEVGYLLHRPFWKHGYAAEAARAVRDHAFTVLERPHVISLIRPINHPSQAVARKMGMRPGKLTLHGGLEHIVFRVDRQDVMATGRSSRSAK